MEIIKTLLISLATAGALVGSPSSQAVDSVSLELGGGEDTRMVRAGLQWKWDKQWWKSNGTHIGGYWDLTLSRWSASGDMNRPGERDEVAVLGITPVIRFQNDDLTGFYLEGGIGANLVSGLYSDGKRRLSTRFQFGDHIGIGYVFQNKLDLGLKLQHFSNAGIKKPNTGVDFVVLTGRYDF